MENGSDIKSWRFQDKEYTLIHTDNTKEEQLCIYRAVTSDNRVYYLLRTRHIRISIFSIFPFSGLYHFHVYLHGVLAHVEYLSNVSTEESIVDSIVSKWTSISTLRTAAESPTLASSPTNFRPLSKKGSESETTTTSTNENQKSRTRIFCWSFVCFVFVVGTSFIVAFSV